MMITEIVFKNIPVQFQPAEAPITMIAEIPNFEDPDKFYFRVSDGPYLWPNIEDGKLVWRIAQHERRLWQSGGSVVFGHWSDTSSEQSLSIDQQTIIQNYFY